MKKRGFTLIELVVSASIVGLLGVFMSVMIVNGVESYRRSRKIIDAQEQAASAMREFEKVVRGATTIISSDPDYLQFYAYLAGDMHPAPSKLQYYCDGNNLMKGTIGPQGAGPVYDYPAESETFDRVARDITNCTALFTYFNDASAEITEPVPPDAVRMIKIRVVADEAAWDLPQPIEETTAVSLRNVKTNL